MSERAERAYRRGGFTLLELLVVIAIMAALTAAFPLALNRFVPARRVDAAARQLLSDVRLAEARSVASGEIVDIVPSGSGYDVKASAAKGMSTVSSRSWRSSTQLTLTSADESRALSALRVFPDGSSSGARFVIQDGERMRSLVVSELTSRVRLEAAR
jgi:general secretion pathway protein H